MINIKFGKVLGKIHEGGVTLRRGKVILMLFLAISTLSFSQDINIRRIENAHIIDINSGDTISSHSSDIEAIQQLQNNKIKGLNVKMLGAVYDTDILNTEPIKMKVIDTIDIVVHNYSNIRSDLSAVLDDCNKIYLTSKDSLLKVPYYTFSAKLERVKSWPEAETTYKIVEVPFFFYKSDSIYPTTEPTTMKVRTFANKTHCIRHFVNGVEAPGDNLYNTKSCTPGNSTYAGGSFRHTNTFYDLDRSIDNVIRLEAIDINSGELIGSRECVILKSEAPAQMSGVTIE